MEKDKWTGLLIGRMHNEEVTNGKQWPAAQDR